MGLGCWLVGPGPSFPVASLPLGRAGGARVLNRMVQLVDAYLEGVFWDLEDAGVGLARFDWARAPRARVLFGGYVRALTVDEVHLRDNLRLARFAEVGVLLLSARSHLLDIFLPMARLACSVE